MKVRVLGCSGGIGKSCHTTSYLLNGNILLDAGTGVGKLSLDEMSAIKHVLLTHAHLDHIAGLALMLGSIYEKALNSVTIHAPKSVLAVLKSHVFNWKLWPDFNQLPDKENPILLFNELSPDMTSSIDEFEITPILLSHTVDSYAYIINNSTSNFCFCGDTGPTTKLWNVLNNIDADNQIIIEASYPNNEADLAGQSGHYTPLLLATDIEKLTHKTMVYIHHIKPGNEEIVIEQCHEAFKEKSLTILLDEQELDF